MVGDSMLGGLQAINKRLRANGGAGISPGNVVDIGNYGGKTTEDMIDLVKPALRRNPAKLIVMSGTNDFDQHVDTIHHAKVLIRTIREIAPSTQLALTEICDRRDHHAPATGQIADMNNRLKALCRHEQVELISTRAFNYECLSHGLLHPNDKGNIVLKDLFNIFINK